MKILRPAVVFIFAFVLLSCARTKAVTDHCDDKLSFDVVFGEGGGRAMVKMEGREVSLPGVRSASGAKYSDGRIVYRNCRAAKAD